MTSERIVLADTITKLPHDAAHGVIVSSSHGGRYAGFLALKARPAGFILNDAGVGKDEAGIACLSLAERHGVAAATVSHMSCRIGHVTEMWRDGVISRVNRLASEAGVRPGMPCSAAAERLSLLRAPAQTRLPDYTEGRRILREPGWVRSIVLVDSAASAQPEDSGRIVVSGSHGALVGGRPEMALRTEALCGVHLHRRHHLRGEPHRTGRRLHRGRTTEAVPRRSGPEALMGIFTGQMAIITGAASGIGAAIAEAFLAEGSRVLALDLAYSRNGPKTKGPNHIQMGCDVASEADCNAVAALAVATFGRIDVLVNCAGLGRDIPFLDTPRDVFDRVMRVNAGGVFQLSRDIAREMAGTGGGAIVNIASISGLVGSKGRVAYGGSKAAVITMTKVMATDLGRFGIRVNAVAPGPVDTPMTKAVYTDADRRRYTERIPLARFGTPENIADAVLFLASPRAAYITGQTLAVDGGFSSAGLMPD
jgi:3-oxoacyl-[acyl-carrier protein] reductase